MSKTELKKKPGRPRNVDVAAEEFFNLTVTAPKAAVLLRTLASELPAKGGIILMSRQAMLERSGLTQPTLERALRVLIEGGWVQRIKVGSAVALALNTSQDLTKTASFMARVVTTTAEQDDLRAVQIKQLPGGVFMAND